jgi:hypothetical protein
MRESIYAEIDQERAAQDAEWGGAEHDDSHGAVDWAAFIRKHLSKAFQLPLERATFRRQMVRIAALAVAAVEWHDRQLEQAEQTV